MSVQGDERSGSGARPFRAGRFIPGGGPSSVARGARGAGVDARAWLCPSRLCYDIRLYIILTPFNSLSLTDLGVSLHSKKEFCL